MTHRVNHLNNYVGVEQPLALSRSAKNKNTVFRILGQQIEQDFPRQENPGSWERPRLCSEALLYR